MLCGRLTEVYGWVQITQRCDTYSVSAVPKFRLVKTAYLPVMRAFFPALPGLIDGRAGLGELGRTLGRGLGRGLEIAGRGDGLLGRGEIDGRGDDDGRGEVTRGRGEVTLGREVLGTTLRLLPVIRDCLPVFPIPLGLPLVDGCVGNCALG